MQLTLEELEEIKRALNQILSARIQYAFVESNKKRLETNEKYKKMDNELIGKIIEEINKLKENKQYEKLSRY